MSPDLVIVTTPLGVIRFLQCDADCYALGELTITDWTTQDERRVFQPGTWSEAEAFDATGHWLYTIAVKPHPVVLRILGGVH